ncbi:MAG: hypothetical protein QT00_C0001G0323 [archaeon GW2011_AR5]|nr:MAG: hypothetical protein QT00_C0001G0323 [archaeon GW2011_AR5]
MAICRYVGKFAGDGTRVTRRELRRAYQRHEEYLRMLYGNDIGNINQPKPRSSYPRHETQRQ